MTDIILNAKNVSKFNKRLQKALSEHFGVDVKLHEAATLFAKAIGVDNEHELKVVLDKSKNSEKSFKEQLKSFSLKNEELEFIVTHFQSVLRKSSAEFIFIDFNEDRDGIFPGLFTVGFEPYETQKNSLLEDWIDNNNIGLEDFLSNSKRIDLKKPSHLKIIEELKNIDNVNALTQLLFDKNDSERHLVKLIDDCDDSIIIERDKITLNLRHNARIIQDKKTSNKLK